MPAKTSRRRQRHRKNVSPKPISRSPLIHRKIPYYNLLDEESLDRIESHADWLLAEIGIEIRDDPDSIQLFKDAGATVNGQLLRFDPGHLRSLCETAPKTFTMYARNPEHSVEFGGSHLIFGPGYGSPFVSDLQGGRRYGTIEDFKNFVKLTYLSPWLQHQSGTLCEPMDIAVNKRHLDMLYWHLRYSDKPFMGSVTAPERAEDSLAMARIVFGQDYMENHLVIQGNINVNSPLVYDGTMSRALRIYAAANQGTVVSPFILGGAMSPVTLAAVLAQAHAEVLTGIALTQLVRKGSPVVYGAFLTTMDLKSGAPTFGTPESTIATLAIAQLCRRLGLPLRCGGHLTASKVADAQSMQESVNSMNPAILAGANFVFQAAGWLEGGLTMGYEKFVMDAEQCGAYARMVQGLDTGDEQFAHDAYIEAGIGNNFLGVQHTMRHFRTANFNTSLSDTHSFEQWTESGSKDTCRRAYTQWNQQLSNYEIPSMDPAINDALSDYIARKKAAVPDAWY